ncbi:dTMP kinase [Pseudalkalibacillus caeni]|uniref:Thymidylate kinase n=1 Tax=Exobacillus caeni TaxID=2574798 RepID=A0A5R9EYF5_9BACL|nr:dTMP kinase [Pseudalkalibacillus caeni]TLS35090.1 dTMP kinase [Pseudalkalibacillus caeni]
MKGLFITFEGPDGAGKTTQIKKLAEYLENKGIPYIHTREPGGTRISDKIRSLILDPANEEMVNETEVLLYAASRSQHVKEKILPALNEGKIVLCDRFVDASIAYQGYGLGISVEQVKEINRFATGGLAADRSYLIDLPVEEGRNRMAARYETQTNGQGLDRIEQKHADYHQTVRQAFLKLAEENANRIQLINGNRNAEMIFEEIKEDFETFYINTFNKE